MSKTFDAVHVRRDFPILDERKLAYLDTAASAQKPEPVLKQIHEFARSHYANVHRGLYSLSQESTYLFEQARSTAAHFLGAKSSDEIVFTKGTTDSINLLANSFTQTLKPTDAVLVTELEHHSNFVPWQMACKRSGAKFIVAPVTMAGEIDIERFNELLLLHKPRLVSLGHVSNALGTIHDVKKLITAAKSCGSLVAIDGAQAVMHMKIDVQDLDCDFYTFSGHKIYGPTGIGILYGKQDSWQHIRPYQFGGEMVDEVGVAHTTFKEAPSRYEAGTPDFVSAVGLKYTLDYFCQWDLKDIAAHERAMAELLHQIVLDLPGATIYGPALGKKSALVTFTLAGVQPQDFATLLDQSGVCVRVGHHCAMPIHTKLGIHASIRASLGMYTTETDLKQFQEAAQKAIKMLRG